MLSIDDFVFTFYCLGHASSAMHFLKHVLLLDAFFPDLFGCVCSGMIGFPSKFRTSQKKKSPAEEAASAIGVLRICKGSVFA